MSLGKGKYDELCTYVREKAKAAGAAIIVVEGEKGMGFSIQMNPIHMIQLAATLRKMADSLDSAIHTDIAELMKHATPVAKSTTNMVDGDLQEINLVDRPHRWCGPCASYHVDPLNREEHAALQCRAPWVPEEKPEKS